MRSNSQRYAQVRRSWQIKKLMGCIVVVILACFCVTAESNAVFANDDGGAEGGGGGSGSTDASCAANAFQFPCGPNGQENGDGSDCSR